MARPSATHFWYVRIEIHRRTALKRGAVCFRSIGNGNFAECPTCGRLGHDPSASKLLINAVGTLASYKRRFECQKCENRDEFLFPTRKSVQSAIVELRQHVGKVSQLHI